MNIGGLAIPMWKIVGAILLILLLWVQFTRRLKTSSVGFAFLSYSIRSKRAAALMQTIKDELATHDIDFYDYVAVPVEQTAELFQTIQNNLEEAIQKADCSIEVRAMPINQRDWVEYERAIMRRSDIPRIFLCVDQYDVLNKPTSDKAYMLNFWDGQRSLINFPNQFVRAKDEDAALGDNPAVYLGGFGRRAVEMRLRCASFVQTLSRCIARRNWAPMRKLEGKLLHQWKRWNATK
jgi:hypothetical protein